MSTQNNVGNLNLKDYLITLKQVQGIEDYQDLGHTLSSISLIPEEEMELLDKLNAS